MKRLLFVLFILVSVSVFCQEKPKKVFCELLGSTKFMSSKVNVTIDFGQSVSFWSGNSKQGLVDENGKAIEFNSMVDAMNYMGALGWVFEQAYVVTSSGNQNVYHWLLSKDITSKDELKEGFKTKDDFEKDKKKKEDENTK